MSGFINTLSASSPAAHDSSHHPASAEAGGAGPSHHVPRSDEPGHEARVEGDARILDASMEADNQRGAGRVAPVPPYPVTLGWRIFNDGSAVADALRQCPHLEPRMVHTVSGDQGKLCQQGEQIEPRNRDSRIRDGDISEP